MTLNLIQDRATELDERVRAVRAPRPVLNRQKERELTDRQRYLLDQLGQLFDGGFAHLTMADIASRLNCSLRTLYSLAPSRDELVLVVVDQNLWKVGRAAMGAFHPGMTPLEAIRTYLRAANMAVANTTEAFAQDLGAVPTAQRLSDDHSAYLVAVTRCLLNLAVERGDIGDVDTAAMARLMAGVGRDFSRAEVVASLRSSPKDSANQALDVILHGLTAPRAGPTK
ncbi:MAG: TetR/AcrR family transcriptional regulator [Actinomycetota bacterium]|nr:TetR/AcrR family transcriptional regulator [Actinomycetota bacterium]